MEQVQAKNNRIASDLENAYMEVIPFPDIEKRFEILKPNSHLAVTCSPTKGVDETLQLCEKLVDRGFEVTPHIAAKCVEDSAHLESIVKKMEALNISLDLNSCETFFSGSVLSSIITPPSGEFESR